MTDRVCGISEASERLVLISPNPSISADRTTSPLHPRTQGMPAKQEERIALTSARDLLAYFAQIAASLQEPETEDSWQRLDRALARLEVVTKSGGYKYEDFVALFKGIANPIISSVSFLIV